MAIQTVRVTDGWLVISYEGGQSKQWRLPPNEDKAGIRKLRRLAEVFAFENDARKGQCDAIVKALCEADYRLQPSRAEYRERRKR